MTFNVRHKSLTGYLILLHLLLAVLVLKTDFLPRLTAKLGNNTTHTSDPHVANMLKHQRWMDDAVPAGAIIFLGDSITQSLATAAVAPYSVNYGIGTATTSDLLQAMPNYRSLGRADTVVLAIGINDILRGKQEGLSERYRQIVQSIPPSTALVWSGVMPAARTLADPDQITFANQTIKALCAARPNCVFLDTVILLSNNREPNPELFLKDGLHLSPVGYKTWIAALKRAISS